MFGIDESLIISNVDDVGLEESSRYIRVKVGVKYEEIDGSLN